VITRSPDGSRITRSPDGSRIQNRTSAPARYAGVA
jgi:hypothetical protein